MKKQRMTVSTFLMAFLLAALVSFASLMCLNDAFLLSCDRATLLAWACGAAAVGAGAMWFRRSGVVSAMAGVVFLGLMVWFRGPLSESFQGFLYAVTSEYALCYPSMTVLGQADASPMVFLMFLAVPLAWLTAWTSSREGSALLVLLACAPVLLLCLIIVDIAPVFWLVLLTGALVLLLLSQSVRERNPAEGSRLAWWLVLPTVILVAGITVLWPPAAYERAEWSEALQALAEAKVSFESVESQVVSSVTAPRWSSSLREVDLRQLGPRVTTGAEVLQYQATGSISYLRGVSLGIYENSTWSAIPQREFTAQNFAQNPLTLGDPVKDIQSLSLQAHGREPLLYTTYNLTGMPEDSSAVDDAYANNPSGSLSYTLPYSSAALTAREDLADYDAYVRDHYTQVPEDLLPALLEVAAQAGLDSSGSPQAVAAYVRDSGTYDLNTPRIPDGADFVLYFLQESHRGYCVHFASATVMLLRALDIPARYVTGYAVSGPAGQWNSVTDEDAHAWVEYYVDGTGWLPLDPTPAADETAPGPDESNASTVDEPVPTPEDTEPQPTGDSPDTPEPDNNQAPEEPDKPEESVPVSAASPSGSGGRLRLPRPLLWLLAAAALAGLIALRRWLILKGRRDRCRRGHPNRRALTLWRWLVHLSKADGIPIPEEQICLAEKARFSQHTLTEEELAQLQQALDERIQALGHIPLAKRLWYQFGLALF